ncbi:zinc ribbon domain-containing protein YjdM [Gayadomonas joobiniege]|uniref:zinc ribbon domain-containing protein YjdM n=1 Tax=Gayadomonas joobiniege TaxID=1234606 RepID=UPI00036DB535|nr:zinc ribbon domain-containing protein YjdM [Gayadomonas joobiniege]
MSSNPIPECPQCGSKYAYPDQNLLVCPECGHEWDPKQVEQDDQMTARDFNGTLLVDGDKVTVAKDLKIKSSSQVIKIGTKATIRRVLDKKDHELDCKVDGVGEMMITAKFVKKA